MPQSRWTTVAMVIAALMCLPVAAVAGGYKGGGGGMHGWGGTHGWGGGYGPKPRPRAFNGPLRYAPTFNPVPTSYGESFGGAESVQYSREGGGYPPSQAYYGPGTAHLSSGFQHYGTALERWYGRGYDAPAVLPRRVACGGSAPACAPYRVGHRPVAIRHRAALTRVAYRGPSMRTAPIYGAPCACGGDTIE